MKNSIVVCSVVGIFLVSSAVAASVIISNVNVQSAATDVRVPPQPIVVSEPIVHEPAMADTPAQNSLKTSPDGSLQEEKKASVSTALLPQPPLKPKEPLCNESDIMEQYDCYNKFYVELVRMRGSTAAMEHIKAKYNAGDPFFRSQCHQLTHMVGRAATDKYATVSEAYTHGDSFCWSGYYHGVMEGIVSKMGGDVANRLDSICSDIPGKAQYTFDYYNCVHGLGHGVMYILNNEVIESLKLCDNLTGWWEQSSCHGGVFMENIIADEVNHKSKYISKVDPQYPCNIVDAKYKTTCYLMQTSHMLILVDGNFEKVFLQCEEVPEEYRNTCYQSLGRDASGRSVSSVAQTRISCMLGQNADAIKYCFRGAVMDFIAYHHSDVQAKELCAALPENLQSDCFLTESDYYKRF